jgi:hypothetical protein
MSLISQEIALSILSAFTLKNDKKPQLYIEIFGFSTRSFNYTPEWKY